MRILSIIAFFFVAPAFAIVDFVEFECTFADDKIRQIQSDTMEVYWRFNYEPVIATPIATTSESHFSGFILVGEGKFDSYTLLLPMQSKWNIRNMKENNQNAIITHSYINEENSFVQKTEYGNCAKIHEAF